MAIVRISGIARDDIVSLLAWTEETFGVDARFRYEKLIAAALRDLAEDPQRPGSVVRQELGDGVRSYHLRHGRKRAREHGVAVRKPRHLLLYCLGHSGLVVVGRVLHDSMELDRHLPEDNGDWE